MNIADVVYTDKFLYLGGYLTELAEYSDRVISYKINTITFRLINPKADGSCGYYLMHMVGNVLNKNNWDLEHYKTDFKEMNTYQMNEYDAANFLLNNGANLLCITEHNAPTVSLFIDDTKPWVILYNNNSHWKLFAFQSLVEKQTLYYPIFTTKVVKEIFGIKTDELKSTNLKTATLDSTKTPLKAMPPPEIRRIRDDKLTSSLFDVLDVITTLFKTRSLTELEIMNIIYRHTMIKRSNEDPNDQNSDQLQSFIAEKFNAMLQSNRHNSKTTEMLIEWLARKQPTIYALCVALDCFRFITVDENLKSFSESKYTCSSPDVLCILMTTDNELIVNRAFENRGNVSGNYVRIFHTPLEVSSFIARCKLTQNKRRPSGSSRRSSGNHADERKSSSSASRRRKQKQKEAIESDSNFARELQRQEFINGLRKNDQDAETEVARLLGNDVEWKKLHWDPSKIPRRRVSAARKSVSRRNKALGEIQDEKKREEVKTRYDSELKKIDEEKQMKARQEEADQAFADEIFLEEAHEYRKMRHQRGRSKIEQTPSRIRENEAAVTERIAKNMK